MPTRDALRAAAMDASILIVLQAILTVLTAWMCGVGVQSLLTSAGVALAAVWGLQVGVYLSLAACVRHWGPGVSSGSRKSVCPRRCHSARTSLGTPNENNSQLPTSNSQRELGRTFWAKVATNKLVVANFRPNGATVPWELGVGSWELTMIS